MQFSKLRLSGFKSFVDATELSIANGLTGIVGPNGCGKSNLVEALRWAMGETSPKQMRGGEMDDVIFGGTADRPSRNIAEVGLLLDNADRTAPAEFNDAEELEVSRRIEREHGSTYRINGREVRARDVQIMFADHATGPRSTALVSQGRIGTLISDRPIDRRGLLEEAAGITGLHSRRHEAELRLRGAETNLARLDDVLVTLDAQLKGLQRQARQARRYRKLSDLVRQSEATVLHHRWCDAEAALADARRELALAEQAVAQRTRDAATATTAREEASAAVTPLRSDETRAAAELQRLTIAHGDLDADDRRVAEASAQCETRLAQIADDLVREQALASDAAAAVERLAEERAALDAGAADETAQLGAAAQTLAAAAAALETAETAFTELTGRTAEAEAERNATERRLAEGEARLGRLVAQRAEAAAEGAALTAAMSDAGTAEAAAAALTTAMHALDQARRELATAETTRADADRDLETARQTRDAAAQAHGRLAAEHRALGELVAGSGDDTGAAPLFDTIAVARGYETALGAALGDDLAAPAETAAPRHWRQLDPLPTPAALPTAATPLSRFVRNAGPLARRLALIGVVDDGATGDRLAPTLAPGQRLVTRNGQLWRWDGFTVRDPAANAASTRLAHRRRLAELVVDLADAAVTNDAAAATFATAQSAAAKAGEREQGARERHRTCDGTLEDARAEHDRIARETAAQRARRDTLADIAQRLDNDIAETGRERAASEAALADDAPLAALRRERDAARERRAAAGAAYADAQATHDRLRHDNEARTRRRATLADDAASWGARLDGATGRIAELHQRQAASRAEQAQLAARPAELAEKRRRLMTALADAEQRRAAAADRVAEAETGQAVADRALRAADGALADAREAQVRAEAVAEQAAQAGAVVRDRIVERLACAPAAALETAGVDTAKALPTLDEAGARLDRLLRERENMGPVNLRAEQEAAELEEQLETIRSEREDLLSAIARLRHGIANLNREARQRLLASFEEVDKHFRELFVQLFGGGRAHLSLTESDDPLEAGLEVFASPPGKRLQGLSLLSGGEQALTATALLFAVFLTNPAPICVLDEVDAPLDDANVDRFLTLLEEISRSCRTRFLLVTHHRLTMARMDRLFGVTMGERGVSQLVSVDLAEAQELRQYA